MATARSAKRAKEVGMRKVHGAYRNQLIRQFISESVALSIMALLIAILIVTLFLPDFNTISGKTLSFSLKENPVIFVEIVLVTLITGLISGSYPAFYLSSFLPVKVLKGGVGSGTRNSGILRKVLVVVQFAIATFMNANYLIGILLSAGQTDNIEFYQSAVFTFRPMG